MKRTACISRGFLRRPAVRELVPDLKLLVLTLKLNCESHVGAWVPIGLGEDAGLDPSAVTGGLADLQKRGHIFMDGATGEVFLADFFRENTFKTVPRQRQALDDFNRVQSLAVRERIVRAVVASPECGLGAGIEENHIVTFQGEGKGEGKGEENQFPPTPRKRGNRGGEGGRPQPSNKSNPEAITSASAACMEFWKAYPRQIGLTAAVEAWQTNNLDAHSQAIMEGLEVWKKSAEWKREDGRFIPAPANWLGKARWLDSPAEYKVGVIRNGAGRVVDHERGDVERDYGQAGAI